MSDTKHGELIPNRDDYRPTESMAVVMRSRADVVLMPVMDVALAKQRLEQLQEFCAGYLTESQDGGQDGGDYGVIPGAGKKKVLLKSGSEKLCDVYGLADRYRILTTLEDFDRGLFDYTIACDLVRKTDEMFVGSGLGSCSSYESKYRWREARRVCPRCQQATIIKGKEEYGGGWLCFKKANGCGAKFAPTDQSIVGQVIGRQENPDIADTKNTVLKMAKKRAKIDAVIGVTRSSGIFTQDLDEREEPTAPSVEAAALTQVSPSANDLLMRAPEGLRDTLEKAFATLTFSAGLRLAKLNEFFGVEGVDPEAAGLELLTWCRNEYAKRQTGQPMKPKVGNGNAKAKPVDTEGDRAERKDGAPDVGAVGEGAGPARPAASEPTVEFFE